MSGTPQEINQALESARIIALSFQKLYKTTDLSEMMSISDEVIAECWDNRKKIECWDTYVKGAIRKSLKDYIRKEIRTRKFRNRLKRDPPNRYED